MDYGNQLKTYRKKVGLSQKEAAQRLGINYYQLCNYELNRSEPNIDTLIKISRLYNVSLDTLLVGESVDDQLKAKIKEAILNDDSLLDALAISFAKLFNKAE